MTACLTGTMNYHQTKKEKRKYLIGKMHPWFMVFQICEHFLQAQLGFSLGRPQNSFNEMRLSVCDSYTYCNRCVHPLSLEECKNVWICGEKMHIKDAVINYSPSSLGGCLHFWNYSRNPHATGTLNGLWKAWSIEQVSMVQSKYEL